MRRMNNSDFEAPVKCYDKQSSDGSFVLSRAAPILSREEELELAQRKDTDKSAREKLIMANLRFASRCARRFSGYGIPFDDLLSEAIVGLTVGIDSFDHTKGFRVLTYVVHWINQKLARYVMTYPLVRLKHGPRQHKAFWKLRAAIKKYTFEETTDYAKVAAEIGCSEQELSEWMPAILDGVHRFEEIPLDAANDSDPFEDALLTERKEFWDACMAKLPEKRQIILTMRYSDDASTLEDIGNVLGCTRENVRQHEMKAIDKLQRLTRVLRMGDPRG